MVEWLVELKDSIVGGISEGFHSVGQGIGENFEEWLADCIMSLFGVIRDVSFPVCMILMLAFFIMYLLGYNKGKRNCLLAYISYVIIRGTLG